MAFNPIALYSDPVKYKEVLEQGSHRFDQITPNIEFLYSDILTGLRSDIPIANAAIEHGPSSEEYQYAKKYFFDEGAEVSIENFHETRNYFEQNLSRLEQRKEFIQWATRVLLPCIGVQGIIKETRALFIEAPVIDNPFQLTAEEVYDLLEGINGQTADQLIRLIKCPLMARRQLLDAYRGKDRVTFISVLEDPSNNCDCSDIDKYANTEGGQKTVLHYNKINNISKTLEAGLPCNQPLEHSQVSLSTLSEYIKDDEIKSIFDCYRFRVENEDSSPISIIFDYIILPDNPKVKELYYYVFDENSEYSAIEREVLESILRRPEGLEIYNKYKAEYEKERLEAPAEELEPEEQDDETADVVVEKSPVSEEASSKAAFTPTLDYSDPAYITFEEFAGLDVLEDGNKYFIDSKTFPIDESKARWSYETTTRLYEFLASYKILVDTKGKVQQKTTLIEHTPDNYYSFLVRMTGRINHYREPKTINLLAQKPDMLAYFIGRAVHKRKDATGINHEDVEARIKKARYENGIWQKTFEIFFHTDGKVNYKRVSDCATLAEKTRDPYELKCNELCIQLFGELK